MEHINRDVTKFSNILCGTECDRDFLLSLTQTYPWFETPWLILADRLLDEGDFEGWIDLRRRNPLLFIEPKFNKIDKNKIVLPPPLPTATDLAIEGFLSRKIVRIDPTNEVNFNDLSSSIEAEIISENFADILLTQGHKKRAIEIFKQLSLKNPEKSVYFASRIASIDIEVAD